MKSYKFRQDFQDIMKSKSITLEMVDEKGRVVNKKIKFKKSIFKTLVSIIVIKGLTDKDPLSYIRLLLDHQKAIDEQNLKYKILEEQSKGLMPLLQAFNDKIDQVENKIDGNKTTNQ